MIKFKKTFFAVNLIIAIACSSPAYAQAQNLRVPILSKDELHKYKLMNSLLALDRGYYKLGKMLSEKYTLHRTAGEERPFVVMIKGAGGLGKTTLINIIKRHLEEIGLRVAAPGKVAYSDMMGYTTWSGYQEIINNDKKADIILCEATDVLPYDDTDLLDLFVDFKASEYIRRKRVLHKGGKIEIAPGAESYKNRSPDMKIINEKPNGENWFNEKEIDELFRLGFDVTSFVKDINRTDLLSKAEKIDTTLKNVRAATRRPSAVLIRNILRTVYRMQTLSRGL
ncbi:P-loop NTPase fold protein [Candidatus Omnitrophota bacterium]